MNNIITIEMTKRMVKFLYMKKSVTAIVASIVIAPSTMTSAPAAKL